MVNEDLLRRLPEEYSALADHRRVMLEVADELAELHSAAMRLGDALESAGLPGRAWRSPDAALRLVVRKLPDITVDDFITRLAEFAAGEGPAWLRGSRGDLERFHREVAALFKVAHRLREALEHRSPPSERHQRPRMIERAFGSTRVLDALGAVDTILGDFKALEPFMAPLAPEEWDTAASGHAESELPASEESRGVHGTLPLSASPARLRDFARATAAPRQLSADGARNPLTQLIHLLRGLSAGSARSKRRVALGAGLLAGLLVLGSLLVALVLHQVSPAHPPAAGATATSGAPAQTAVSSPAVASTTTPLPRSRPTATKTPGPVPALALTCASSGSSATLTIKNIGTTSITWKASAPGSLIVYPSQGQLAVGESRTPSVTTNSGKRHVTGTITVTASNGTASKSFSVSCQ